MLAQVIVVFSTGSDGYHIIDSIIFYGPLPGVAVKITYQFCVSFKCSRVQSD